MGWPEGIAGMESSERSTPESALFDRLYETRRNGASAAGGSIRASVASFAADAARLTGAVHSINGLSVDSTCATTRTSDLIGLKGISRSVSTKTLPD
jgi:hypothetical protein